MTLPRRLQGLLAPSAYDHPARRVELVETHISLVLLAGDYAYKIKKAVRFDFLDYGTLAIRKRMCAREVRLNRRTCPEAYLGVVPIVVRAGSARVGGSGRPVEYAVRMRRLPRDAWLPTLIARGDADSGTLRDIAAALHAFHAGAARGRRVARFGSARTVAAIWRENLDELGRFAGATVTSRQLGVLARFGERFLREHGDLVDARAASGRVRDGHGDLRADSIYVDRASHVCLTDCIEFSDRLRCGDVASDVAFLAMDLDARRRPDLADEFAGAYIELASDDETMPFLLPFYRCQRAIVRAKVERITAADAGAPDPQRRRAAARARRLLALARRYARTPPAVLIVVGGLSGTGKSHFAAALAVRWGAALVRSDAVRRDLESGGNPPKYGAAARASVYAEARERARGHLQAGRPVVLDATHIERREREAASALAAACGVPVLGVWLRCDDRVVRARLAARDAAPDALSDARLETYLAQRRRVEPPLPRERFLRLDGAAAATDNIGLLRDVAAGTLQAWPTR